VGGCKYLAEQGEMNLERSRMLKDEVETRNGAGNDEI
jgi:hypothetical protein